MVVIPAKMKSGLKAVLLGWIGILGAGGVAAVWALLALRFGVIAIVIPCFLAISATLYAAGNS